MVSFYNSNVVGFGQVYDWNFSTVVGKFMKNSLLKNVCMYEYIGYLFVREEVLLSGVFFSNAKIKFGKGGIIIVIELWDSKLGYLLKERVVYFEYLIIKAGFGLYHSKVHIVYEILSNNMFTSNVILNYMLVGFSKEEDYRRIFKDIKNLIEKEHNWPIKGFKLKIKGRFGRGSGTDVYILSGGKLPVRDFSKCIESASGSVILKLGKCSVTVWLYKNNVGKQYIYKGNL